MLLPHNPNAFARFPLDRAAHHRRDAEWIGRALAAAATKVAPLHKGRPLITEGGEIAWLNAPAVARLGEGNERLFLGVDAGSVAHFAIAVEDAQALEGLGRFEDLRAHGPRLGRDDLALLGAAKSVFEWHARHGFCANCGAATVVAEAGWKRECLSCKAEHFPRVDPVVIMAPVYGDKLLLGRQRAWPAGMHSALAGYVEPGETLEEAVARETLEEAGLVVRDVKFHSTQPWPFPHSLMIGAICEVTHDRETVDAHELESALWFTREEARLLVAGKYSGAFCPPPFAIAHQLIKSWAEG